MQGEALKIFEPENLRPVNHARAIEHLHQAVVNAENQQRDRENDLDQDHSLEAWFDLDPDVVGVHRRYLSFLRYSIISSISLSVTSGWGITSSNPATIFFSG